MDDSGEPDDRAVAVSRRPPTPEGDEAQRIAARVARNLYRVRRLRARAFADHAAMFGEPAWDILLNLYIAHSSGRGVSRVRASTAGGVPQTTGLRILTALEEQGLVIRTDDPRDRRRSFIGLSENAISKMEVSLLAFADQAGSAPKSSRPSRRAQPVDARQALQHEQACEDDERR